MNENMRKREEKGDHFICPPIDRHFVSFDREETESVSASVHCRLLTDLDWAVEKSLFQGRYGIQSDCSPLSVDCRDGGESRPIGRRWGRKRRRDGEVSTKKNAWEHCEWSSPVLSLSVPSTECPVVANRLILPDCVSAW